MATMNPFDLLGDVESDDLNLIIAAQPKKDLAPAPEKAPAKAPAKRPVQNAKEPKTEPGRQGGRGGDRAFNDRGYGRGGGGDRGNNDRGYGRGGDRGYTDRGSGRGGGGGFGYSKDQPKENSFNDGGLSAGQAGKEDVDGKTCERRGGYNGPPRSNSFRGGRRGGDFGNGEVGNEERPRRNYERRSGTGRGYDVKREGAGRGNWGTAGDEIAQESAEVVAENDAEKNVDVEKPSGEEEKDVNKEAIAKEAEDKEAEDKEMTLQEYEKVLEEKRKALQALKTTEERKVDDKAFATMQPLSSKKNNDEIFAKLGADKKKELAEKEEKAKKTPVSINDFLKPAEGEKYYGSGGRRGGRGGGRGGRGPREGGYGGGAKSYHVNAPKIEDPGQFPVLGAK